jgi:hypothetical protein
MLQPTQCRYQKPFRVTLFKGEISPPIKKRPVWSGRRVRVYGEVTAAEVDPKGAES